VKEQLERFALALLLLLAAPKRLGGKFDDRRVELVDLLRSIRAGELRRLLQLLGDFEQFRPAPPGLCGRRQGRAEFPFAVGRWPLFFGRGHRESLSVLTAVR
jgi:hypothetical protein